MNKDQFYEVLFTDYRTTWQDWAPRLQELNAVLDSLQGQRDLLHDLKTDRDLQEAIVLLGETHKEGAVNGSNAETRKLQTTVLLAHLRESDPEWIQLAKAIRQVEAAIEEADIRKEKVLAQISFLRNRARMIGGLAYALGG